MCSCLNGPKMSWPRYEYGVLDSKKKLTKMDCNCRYKSVWCSSSMHYEKLWELHGSATPVTGKVMRGLSKEWVIEVRKNPSKPFFLFFYRKTSELKLDPACWVWNVHGCIMKYSSKLGRKLLNDTHVPIGNHFQVT